MSFIEKASKEWEQVSKKLNFAMGETISKTKEIAGVAKLNTAISARRREIENTYTEMGRRLFERECHDPNSPVATLCAKVRANMDAIADMKQEIDAIKAATEENRKARSEEIFGKNESAVSEEEPVESDLPGADEEPIGEEAEAMPIEAEPLTAEEPQADETETEQ